MQNRSQGSKAVRDNEELNPKGVQQILMEVWTS